jgi:hypothetical protein
MAPLKCNYTIFTSDKSFDANIDIKLFNTKIAMNEEITFLGIRFDRHLSFKNQINYLKESCSKRMNVLKVLSNKSWGLSVKTLMEVYNSLIRS